MPIRLHTLSTKLLTVAAAVAMTVLAAEAAAQDRAGTAKAGAQSDKRESRAERPARAELSPSDERAALAFAQEHHPELHTLLVRLREGRRGQYLTAIRQLHNTRERLERLSERTPSRYEASLAQWKIDSRLRLLVARMTMSDDPALEEELQELLAERTRLRLELLKLDRQRLRSRLEKIEKQIEQLETDPAAVAEKDLAAIRRSLGIPPKKARKKKPAPTGP